MLVEKEFDVCVSSPQAARKHVEEKLEKMGIKNANFDSIIFTDLGGYNGYKVKISYNQTVKIVVKTDVEKMRIIRQNTALLKNALVEIDKKREELAKKLKSVQDNCRHDLLVQLKPYDNETTDNPYYCLICNRLFPDQFILYEKCPTRQFIHFENLSGLTYEEKSQLAFDIFKKLKQENPDYDNEQIVSMINEEAKQKVKK